MNPDLEIGFACESGRHSVNEDFVAARRPAPDEDELGFICAIADGVYTGGEALMAAQTSVVTLIEDYFGTPPNWDTATALRRLIASHNRWLAHHNRRSEHAALSTLTALVLRGGGWTLAHVGDTRAYLVRAGDLRVLTQDSAPKPGAAAHEPARVLGRDDTIRIDFSHGELERDDCFVLLSDGVYAKLAAPQISWLVARGSASLASLSLVAAARAAGSQDNASALVVRVHGVAAAAAPAHVTSGLSAA